APRTLHPRAIGGGDHRVGRRYRADRALLTDPEEVVHGHTHGQSTVGLGLPAGGTGALRSRRPRTCCCSQNTHTHPQDYTASGPGTWLSSVRQHDHKRVVASLTKGDRDGVELAVPRCRRQHPDGRRATERVVHLPGRRRELAGRELAGTLRGWSEHG